jgi:hypothetical protein
MAALTIADLQPSFYISSITENCARNGNWYDKNGGVKGKLCPLSGKPIRKSGEKVTRSVLTDSGDSILMPDGYCYNRTALITYIKSEIGKGIRVDNIKSPMTQTPFPQAEIRRFHDSGLMNFDNIFDNATTYNSTNELFYYDFIQAGFYFSFNNSNNNLMAENILFLWHVNQHVEKLGATDNIHFVKCIIVQNYLNFFNANKNRDVLEPFFSASQMFMPFVTFKKSIEYFLQPLIEIEYNDDFVLNWNNNLFFNPRCREILNRIGTQTLLPERYTSSSDPSRSGTIRTSDAVLFNHGNTNSSQVVAWDQLIAHFKRQKIDFERPSVALRPSIGGSIKFPLRYLPQKLTKKDKKKQIKMLLKSKKMYKQNKYYTRKNVSSYKSKKSKHILNASKIYGIKNIALGKELAQKTGCKLSALKKIVKKGEGAYYSSGSRPNQTSQSWGLARLASSLTSGKAAAVDYDIIKDGCDHNKKAFILANKAKQKYGYGHSKTRKATVTL